MCYLVAKRFDGKGCLAMKVKHGKALADFTEALQKKIGDNGVQLITVSYTHLTLPTKLEV